MTDTGKKGAVAVRRATPPPLTKAQQAKLDKQALDQANAVRLAQIVNLHIAGLSLTDIGNSIGASADEVDRMLQRDAARYVRSQPALRVYVRNYLSEKYSALLEAVWEDATDTDPPPTGAGSKGGVSALGFDKKLASQDRAIRILDSMRKLHGADAPIQTEVKIETAPEAVEKLVSALSAAQGRGYDTSIFDDPTIVDAEVVHEAHSQSEVALNEAADRVGDVDPDDPEDL